jgi:hypothetical protein
MYRSKLAQRAQKSIELCVCRWRVGRHRVSPRRLTKADAGSFSAPVTAAPLRVVGGRLRAEAGHSGLRLSNLESDQAMNAIVQLLYYIQHDTRQEGCRSWGNEATQREASSCYNAFHVKLQHPPDVS